MFGNVLFWLGLVASLGIGYTPEVEGDKPPSNPILSLFDMVLEVVFLSSIDRQHREAKPVMENRTHYLTDCITRRTPGG